MAGGVSDTTPLPVRALVPVIFAVLSPEEKPLTVITIAQDRAEGQPEALEDLHRVEDSEEREAPFLYEEKPSWLTTVSLPPDLSLHQEAEGEELQWKQSQQVELVLAGIQHAILGCYL
ncbi:hypothetical protein SAY87_010088 [Trapa incisa]|uniref:Uncharacterized protein n=1 Tax=Trapa incisa TaxID=236973 RepID=A0AAN7GH86_9MYRT|nr:hypothetical protein SAY87_010088 [Trapa incisa]